MIILPAICNLHMDGCVADLSVFETDQILKGSSECMRQYGLIPTRTSHIKRQLQWGTKPKQTERFVPSQVSLKLPALPPGLMTDTFHIQFSAVHSIFQKRPHSKTWDENDGLRPPKFGVPKRPGWFRSRTLPQKDCVHQGAENGLWVRQDQQAVCQWFHGLSDLWLPMMMWLRELLKQSWFAVSHDGYKTSEG